MRRNHRKNQVESGLEIFYDKPNCTKFDKYIKLRYN